MKQFTHLLFALLLISFFSCSKDDLTSTDPSSTSIDFEGEGGVKNISFTNKDWKITKVVNQDNNQTIFGNIYSFDGNLIQENKILELDSFGSLEAIWSDKGFIIKHETETSVVIQLKENFTNKNFHFIIFLESGNDTKEIAINQKPSQGYTIKNIKYTIENNDNDSIFVEKGSTHSFNINSTTQQGFSFDPFINSFELSQFKSNSESAFPWKLTDSIAIEIPAHIIDNKVFTNDATSFYSNSLIQKPSKFKGQITEVAIPQGQTKFIVELEYRKRQVSYILHLVNNRTNEDKIITGKWVETAPTGNYKIEWQ